MDAPILIPLRHRTLKGDDQRVANQRLYSYLRRCALRGATDPELKAAGHLVQTRWQLVLKGVVFDSGQEREGVVWTADAFTPNHPDPRAIMEPPSVVEMSRYGMGLGSPPTPIPQCARGTAFALVAIAIELLTGEPQRLCWVVDLKTDVTLTPDDLASHPTDPAEPSPKGSWGDLLYRLRAALDNQEWGSFDCEFVLWLHIHVRSSDTWHWALYTIPWKIDLTRIPGRTPPAGRWLLQRRPPMQPRSFDREGDLPIGDWWMDGAPF